MNCKHLLITTIATVTITFFAIGHATAQEQAANTTLKASNNAENCKKNKKIKPIAPINMSNGVVLPKGKAVICFKAKFIDKDELYNGENEKSGTYNSKYDRTQRTYQAIMRYGVADGFDIRAIIPYKNSAVSRRAKAGTANENTYEDSNMGLGDVSVIGRYALWSQRQGDPFSLAVGAGIKMPTGDSNKKNRAPFSNNFEYMDPSFQLGTGSWDPKLELGITKVFGRSRLDAHLMYTFGCKGDHGFKKGDQFNYNLGWGYALTQLFDVELELNGVNQNRNENDGRIVANTGGNTLYLTPGVKFKFTDRFNAGLAVPYVIHRDLNADNDGQKYGIGEDYQVVFKLAYKLN